MLSRSLTVLTMMFLLLAVTVAVRADDEELPAPSLDSDYVLGDGGYWWYGGNAYTRVSTWNPGYYFWRGCCRYWQPGYYSYSYKIVVNKAAPDRWTQLARFKAKIEDDRLFAQTMTTLFPSASYQNYAAQQYGVGQSVYTYQQQSATYGQVDLNAALQNFAQTVKAQVEAGAAAGDQLGGVTQGVFDNAAEIATNNARYAAALELLKPAASSRSQTTITQSVPETGVQAQAQASAGPTASLTTTMNPKLIMVQKCSGCHSAGKEFVQKFDIAAYPTMALEQQAKVWKMINPNYDPAKRMPRSGAHGEQPGVPLTQQEFLAVVTGKWN